VVAAAGSLIRVSGIANSDRHRYLFCMDEMVSASQRPMHEALAIMGAMGPRLRAERSWIPSFTDSLVPSLVHVGDAFARDAANIANAETAIAIERYRLANGNAVPERLEELVPAFLDAVPVDPFDGNPLRYRRDETGYSVYSINENQRDDGGKPAGHEQGGQSADLVFHVEYGPAAAH
jgi:phosphatidylserine/phosphatidylglycerophosphate/cardiolipin synthase-like enzyme